MFSRESLLVLILLFLLRYVKCYPEQGKWDFSVKDFTGSTHYKSEVITKSLYKDGKFITSIICKPDSQNEYKLNVTWYIRKAACWKEYNEILIPIRNTPEQILQALINGGIEIANETTTIFVTGSELIPCDEKKYFLTQTQKELSTLTDISASKAQVATQKKMELENKEFEKFSDIAYDGESSISSRIKRNVSVNGPPVPKVGTSPHDPFFVVPLDGIYQLILGTRISREFSLHNDSFTADFHVEILNDFGYLSAADYPLLIFYGTMCVVYVIYGVGWLVVSFMRWRELLRVQYWIGAVILLGMLEKAVFTAEYESVNKRGVSVPGLIVFAELVSCAKRTLARMLIIIVSFGFGIVKPRLGIVLHRVVGVGSLYFILASIEACVRALQPKMITDDYSKRLMFAIIPLALLESAICWWVFSALVSTTRTLRLRRNTIKLNLFRHFTNTLIFAVVTSVIFMLWSIKYQNFDMCLSDWKQLWVSDAFWHVLFALILLVIMILWRPTNNNQRFAFSPLLDEGSDGDDEEEEKLMANVSDTMKLRSSKATSNSSSPRESRTVEDDLKWLEENIPSSVTNTALPVMDSDEEILTTKFEISKMQ